MIIKKTLLLFIFSILHLGVIGQISQRENRNLSAFARMFGYVQYFHPSDEAAKLDWQAFAVYGTKYVIDAKNDDELISRLNKTFKLIGPSLEVYKGTRFNSVNLVPPYKQRYKVVSWQHKGFGLPPIKDDSYYKSLRLNRVPLKGIEYIPLTKSVDLSKFVGQSLIFKVVLNKNYMEKASSITFKPIIYDPSSKTMLDSSSVVRISRKDTNVIEISTKVRVNRCKIALGVAFMPNSKIPLQVDRVDLSIKGVNDVVKTIPIELATDINNNEEGTTYIGFELKDNGFLGRDSLYENHLNFGSYIEKEIVSNINCHIPQALYASEDSTYPSVDPKLFDDFKRQINMAIPKVVKGSDKFIRLADVIILWNILRHSFPYLDDISLPVDKILEFSLREAYKDQGSLDFLTTLKRISSFYNDGHMFVRAYGDLDTLNNGTCPIVFDMVKGQIIVKEVLDSSLASRIIPGDIIDSINHKNSIEYLADQKKLISGSEQWKNYIGLQNLCNGPKGSYCTLAIRRHGSTGNFVVARNKEAIEYRNGNFSSHPLETGWIKPGILYLNLTRDPTLRLMKYIKDSDSAKSVILDLRGYPVDQEVFDLPKLFVTHKKKLNNRMFTPMILHPDFENIEFIGEGSQIFEPYDKFQNAKVFLLVDASAQSAAETLAGMFKDLEIALLVGQPTSGTNGNINNIWLPGRYYVGYSAMKVLNSDGSKQHLKGIIPDVFVEKTLKGLQESRDEILEAAIKMTEIEN